MYDPDKVGIIKLKKYIGVMSGSFVIMEDTTMTDVSSISDKINVIKLCVHDRQYTQYHWIDVDTQKELPDLSPNPLGHCIFHEDIVTYTDDHQVVIRHSPTRTAEYLPGILVLVGNRTYGRSTMGHKRLLYQCIPDNKRLPVFLVPYEHKHLGFSKHIQNKYVLFRWVSWLKGSDKHPLGQLTEVLGDVDHLESFYEYQLYSKSLHSSIKPMQRALESQISKPYTDASIDAAIESIRSTSAYNIEDRTDAYVFTIDPPNSLDYDDGFSIRTDAVSGRTVVTVYIANVFVWLEHFHLWESFSNRVATIYLPDRFRRPMLPTILSDTLCSLKCFPEEATLSEENLLTRTTEASRSLQQGHIRFALAMDFTMDPVTGTMMPLNGPKMVAIRPTANYAYESPELLRDVQYQRLKCVTPGAPKNSHNLVTWWMIHTNSSVAETMKTVHRAGIFRIGKMTEDTKATDMKVNATNTISELDPSIGEDAARIMLHWKHMMGQYVAYNDPDHTDPTHSLRHTWLGRSAYMHMTSPIRRLVDLLNQMLMFEHVLSPAAKTFVETWMGKLDYINTTMRSIRKVESTCQLICLCTTRPEVLSASHRGIVFDKTESDSKYERKIRPGLSGTDLSAYSDERRRSLSEYAYMVYLEDLRVLVRMTRSTHSVDNHSRHDFRLHLFESEHTAKKKIRIGFAM